MGFKHTTVSVLRLFVLGHQRIPIRAKTLVLSIKDGRNWHFQLTNKVIIEVLILIQDTNAKLLTKIFNSKTELFIPGRIQALLHNLSPESVPPKLQFDIGITETIKIHRGQIPPFNHLYTQLHLKKEKTGYGREIKQTQKTKKKYIYAGIFSKNAGNYIKKSRILSFLGN